MGAALAPLSLVQTLRFCRRLTAACLLAIGSAFCSARGEEVSLTSSHDTSLIEVAPNSNNGGQGWVLAGTTQNGTRNRGLFQWDFTGVIPPGATILSVDLALAVTRVPDASRVDSSFSLYRMLVPWGEGNKVAIENRGGQGAPATAGEATWNDRLLGSASWGAPGGAPGVDFLANSSGSQYIYDVGRSPYHFTELVGDVQGWVNNPQSNFGWMLISDDETTPFTARRFGSREEPFGNVPTLTIDYELVPEPGTFWLCGLGLAAFGIGRWRRIPKRWES